MLRLSIIVPHLDDNVGLETTLLSLFENRSSSLEIIVVHNGKYTDPYQLAGDEVVLVEAPKNYGSTEQINLAITASRAPAVQVLFPGTEVSKGWFEPSLRLVEDGAPCASSPCNVIETQQTVFGLDRTALPHRRIATRKSSKTAPLLCGTVFQKRTLDILGGLCPRVGREGAEIELQLLFDALELQTVVAESSGIRGTQKAIVGMEIGYETGRVCGQIACAYGAVEGSGVAVDSLAKQLSHLAGGLMSPKSVAERLGWVMGIRDRSLEESIRSRLTSAAELLEEEAQMQSIVSGLSQSRRAA